MKKHRQYLVSKSEPKEFVSIVSTSPVTVSLPEYESVTKKEYRRAKWLCRKLRMKLKAGRIKLKAGRVKEALMD